MLSIQYEIRKIERGQKKKRTVDMSETKEIVKELSSSNPIYRIVFANGFEYSEYASSEEILKTLVYLIIQDNTGLVAALENKDYTIHKIDLKESVKCTYEGKICVTLQSTSKEIHDVSVQFDGTSDVYDKWDDSTVKERLTRMLLVDTRNNWDIILPAYAKGFKPLKISIIDIKIKKT